MSALRAIREKKGFTLSQLASRAGISTRVLTEYEEGRQTIPLAHARLLAKALWVQIEDLMPPAGSVIAASSAQSIPPSNSSPAYVAPPPPTTRPVESRPEPDTAHPQYGQSIQPDTQPPAPGPRQDTQARSVPRQSASGGGKQSRERRPTTPPAPLSDGQMQELMHLASRLEVSQEQLEERMGKSLDVLSRVEAKEWVKKLRAMADELAPSARTRYGRWPDAHEDREAAYLAEQCEAGAAFMFKLFDGEMLNGAITEFTPYTLTLKSSQGGEEIVLRKLAIAYYRKLSNGGTPGDQEKSPPAGKPDERTHDHERDDSRQPIDKGIDSDRAGDPDLPERDNMDEDRGL